MSPIHYWEETFDNESDRIAPKCLSYAASTTNDWFQIMLGNPLRFHKNFVSNQSENGTDPRELEGLYHDKPNYQFLYNYFGFGLVPDLVTGELIPYNTEGYADILTSPPTDWKNEPDPEIGTFEYNITPDEYLSGYDYEGVGTNGIEAEAHLRKAIDKYGIVYIHADLIYTNLPLHAITLIGYNVTPSPSNPNVNITEFWYHDSYDGESGTDFSRYGTIRIYEINKAWIFFEPQWPTYHHDYRRTGFTLLKGDLTSSNAIRQMEYTLDNSKAPGSIDHPSIADIDGNGKQDIVITTSKYTSPYNGTVYDIERGLFSYSTKWEVNIGNPIPKAPTLENIDSDNYKEVAFGERGYSRNSILFVLDGGQGIQQWNYSMKDKWSPYFELSLSGFPSNTALVDIDLDGEKEVIFTDKTDSACDWPGELYAFSSTGTLKYNITIGNDGSEGGPSIANILGSDYPDVIVPTKCGINAYEFDGTKFVLQWSNSDARIDGNAVIYDIDRDNKYEVIYTTTTASCPEGKSCLNKLYIRDAETGNNEAISPIDLGAYVSKITPAVADITGDSNKEIVITARDSGASNYGRVLCYSAGDGSLVWQFTNGGTLNTLYQAPVIADIDNDGKYNIIIGTGTLENRTYILKEDGSLLFSYQFDGQLGSSPAIGDIDGDSMAEIVVRHEGSNILAELNGFNRQPQLGDISNITANEGEMVVLNESGTMLATDEDNQSLIFYYSWPFNESGYWQTGCNSSGNYSVLVEVSDGNLSDWQYINVEVYDICTDSSNSNLAVSSLTNITINNTHMVFSFIVNNSGSTSLTNVNWTLNAGDGTLVNSAESYSLASGNLDFVYVDHNYSTLDTFIVNATARSSNLLSSKTLVIYLGNESPPSNLDVYNFSMSNNSATDKVFEFMVKNIADNETLSSIGWSLNTGIETINSGYSFDLSPGNFSYVFVQYNYTQTGDFTPIAAASSGINQDSKSLPPIDIPDIESSNLTMLYNNSLSTIFTFQIQNMLSIPLNSVNWTFKPGDGNTISANQLYSINGGQNSWIFIKHTYPSTGTYTANATAINGSLQDSITYGFTLN